MLSPFRLKRELFYGWVVVIAFFIISLTIYGIRYSFGIFFKSLEGDFGLSRAVTSGVLSAFMILCCLTALVGGWALDKYGPRIVVLLMGVFTGLGLLLTSQTTSLWQLFITYSLLLAIGIGPVYVMMMSTVSRWFDKKRGFALGIASSGAPLGTVLMAPFATYLISNFDWRMAYIVIGLIAWFIVIPLSRLLRKDPQEIGVLPDGVKPDSTDSGTPEPQSTAESPRPSDFSLSQAFRTRSFWLFGFMWVLWAICIYLIITHLVPHATDIGISATKAATVLSLMSGIGIIGRMIMGTAADRLGRKATSIICSLCMAGALAWLMWAQELWGLYLFAVVFGFAYGGLPPPMTALLGDTFGVRDMGMIMGALEIGWGIGGAIGPALGGLIFDVTGSYFMAFLIGAVAMLVITLLFTLIRQESVKKPVS